MKTLLLCLIIIMVRIIDTSLNTIRTILTIRNKKKISTIIAFFEILIWFLIVKEAVNRNENAILIAICYSLGYALGILIGMVITDKFFTTNININLVLYNENNILINELIQKDYNVVVNKIEGKKDNYLIMIVTTNKKIKELNKILKKYISKPILII